MLEELQHQSDKSRRLNSLEQELVLCLLNESGEPISIDIQNLRVIDMDDGGMGSLYFLSNHFQVQL